MIAWWQILLLTLYAGYQILDELNWYTCAGSAVFSGMITGLIMGDLQTGLFIGGSMQLTVLGVGTFGGASRIDANSGTLVATAFAVGAGMNPETALAAIGVPVAAILVYTDIAGRFANTFFGHMCDADIEKMNWGAYNVHYLLGAVSWMLSRMIPVFLALAFGQGLVEGITTALNGDLKWLGDGLSVAGGALPAVGFAILLRYLPVKKHVAYLLLGFVIAALFGTAFTSIINLNTNIVAVNAALGKGAVDMVGMFNNMSMLAIAIIGFALSLLYYKNNQRPVAAAGAAEETTTMSSNEKLANGTTGYKITKDDLAQINRRNLLGFQDGWNYERMQHSGYLWIILPTLRKLYGDGTPELKEACRAQCAPFFNTSNFLNTIITGIDLAIEEEEGIEGLEAVAGLKTGLMGPLASIGDSIFGSLLPTIFGALAANMAMNGNPLGIFIWVAVNILVDWFRCKQTHMAYEQGMKLVTTMSDRLNALTDAASVMGVFMVGALVATNVGIVIAAKPVIGGVTVDLQNICNMICPKLVPAALVGFVYWLLGKKGMTSTKAIFIVLVLSIALGAFGIICKG